MKISLFCEKLTNDQNSNERQFNPEPRFASCKMEMHGSGIFRPVVEFSIYGSVKDRLVRFN